MIIYIIFSLLNFIKSYLSDDTEKKLEEVNIMEKLDQSKSVIKDKNMNLK